MSGVNWKVGGGWLDLQFEPFHLSRSEREAVTKHAKSLEAKVRTRNKFVQVLVTFYFLLERAKQLETMEMITTNILITFYFLSKQHETTTMTTSSTYIHDVQHANYKRRHSTTRTASAASSFLKKKLVCWRDPNWNFSKEESHCGDHGKYSVNIFKYYICGRCCGFI